MYFVTTKRNIDFNLAYIRDELHGEPSYMRALFACAYYKAKDGDPRTHQPLVSGREGVEKAALKA